MGRFYVTARALTEGVLAVDGELHDRGILIVGDASRVFGTTYYHGEGKDWHRTEAQAMLRAESMRQAKLKSLRKSLAKLEAMTFKVTE